MKTSILNLSISEDVKRLSCFKGNKGKVYPYIINCIDFEGYDIKEPETVKELLQTLFDTFYSEKLKNFPNWAKYYNNSKQAAFTDWLQGLPSSFNVAFSYYDIIKLAEEWGYISADLSPQHREMREDTVCENWFSFITSNCFQLFNKYGVNTNTNF